MDGTGVEKGQKYLKKKIKFCTYTPRPLAVGQVPSSSPKGCPGKLPTILRLPATRTRRDKIPGSCLFFLCPEFWISNLHSYVCHPNEHFGLTLCLYSTGFWDFWKTALLPSPLSMGTYSSVPLCLTPKRSWALFPSLSPERPCG